VGARRQVPDHLTASHQIADLDRRLDRLEVDPPPRPHDGHQRTTGQSTGVGDDT
jgi:hypothetical protein